MNIFNIFLTQVQNLLSPKKLITYSLAVLALLGTKTPCQLKKHKSSSF